MIYLEKTNQTAIDYVTNFINSNWLLQNDLSSRYQNIGYNEIKNPVDVFRNFFIVEQNGKCCYCCREISNNNSTELEHIIPKSKIEIADFEPYYFHSDILRNNVVPQNIFVTSPDKLTTPPFPHHIAYHNIVASCNGRTFESSENFTCCNRERKDDFVPPFNLMQDSVKYLSDGTIVYLNELANRSYFKILNLDKKILNNIRRLWYLFSQSELNLLEILDDNMPLEEKIVRYAISNSTTPSEDIKLVETFTIPTWWKSFQDYSFFLDYYRNVY